MENSTLCHPNGPLPSIRQCRTASIKLDRVNETESPLMKAFLEAGKLCGLFQEDLNRWSSDGSDTEQNSVIMTSQNTIDRSVGRRWSTYDSHLLPALKISAKAKRKGNLHVLSRSSVSKILLNKNRVTGVQYIDSGGQQKRINIRKEVILSAGSIKTPQILQLSGIGPAHVLEPLDVNEEKKTTLQ